MAADEDPRGVSDGWLRRRARIAFEIERAALQLFATSSPEEVTVEEIARAAGISRRTFFRYFPSRDDVLAALPMRNVHRLCDRFEKRPRHEAVLEAFIAAVIEEEAGGVQDELILLWGKAVLPSLPSEEDRVNNTMVEAYGAVIAMRTGMHPDDARVQVWAAAIASISAWAFLRWLEVGGNRSLILADSLVMLGDLVVEGHGPLQLADRAAVKKVAGRTRSELAVGTKTPVVKKRVAARVRAADVPVTKVPATKPAGIKAAGRKVAAGGSTRTKPTR
jgi:AcrR family transcriptional regulator